MPAGRLSRCSIRVDTPSDRAACHLAADAVVVVTRSKYVSRADRRLNGLADRPLDAVDDCEPQRLEYAGMTWRTLHVALS